MLNGFLDQVQVGLIEDGTAIGLGLATAVNRLRHSEAKNRTVILLTDGSNNIPTLEPETAAELAKALGVRVYTVGVGKKGKVPYPEDSPLFGRRTRMVEVPIDEDLLRRIAAATGGSYFRAEDPAALAQIFATIDELETSRYKTWVTTWYQETDGLVRRAGPGAAAAGGRARGHLAAPGAVRRLPREGSAVRFAAEAWLWFAARAAGAVGPAALERRAGARGPRAPARPARRRARRGPARHGARLATFLPAHRAVLAACWPWRVPSGGPTRSRCASAAPTWSSPWTSRTPCGPRTSYPAAWPARRRNSPGSSTTTSRAASGWCSSPARPSCSAR